MVRRHRSTQRYAKKLKKQKMPTDNEAYECFSEPDKKLLAWRRRPRIHTSELGEHDRAAELLKIFGSEQRLILFKKLAIKYQELPSLENYLQLRRGFSEAELYAGVFDGFEDSFIIAPELEKYGIHSRIVVGAYDACEPDMDELSLRLMECLVARDKLPKSGPGHIEKRRQAIGDALIDYLIVTMLEATEGRRIAIPPSLIVLIRERLCGPNPDWVKHCRSRRDQSIAMFKAAKHFKPDEKVSSRKLAASVGISRSTAARWLADPGFRRWLEDRINPTEARQRRHAAITAAHDISPQEKISPEKIATLVGVAPDVAARWLANPEFLRVVEWVRTLGKKRGSDQDSKHAGSGGVHIRIGPRPLNRAR